MLGALVPKRLVAPPRLPQPSPNLAHIIADGGIPVHEVLHVAIDAAARGELGERGWVSLPLPLPHHHFAGLPLCQHLLVPCCHCCVHLCTDHTMTMRGVPRASSSKLAKHWNFSLEGTWKLRWLNSSS